MNILQVNSSVRGVASASTRLASAITARLQALSPAASLTLRDASAQPILDEAALGALFTPTDARSPAQAARAAIDDATIAEVQAADAIVIGVPMYNFGVPVQLKAWIDAICRAGTTFRYTENGPEGLLKGKKVYIALARGGLYKDTPADSQVPYLKSVLGFLGMKDITFIHAEGLSLGEDAATKAFADADAEIATLAL
ncbi:MAG: FMN-dependent NADH-azoreductase [Candidatus Dactylopiibacterium carminicum]|uniref:FMN dependent NADH:quinone oxidoreductase n=1 Tax=Candidatus Dactylopiibacterium carminicum TaxID=857335 RepID=A0A272EYJ4_9RHOO|nr:NAD(P)H-dependent oxidoreductase [Candidatus Dactylopiibacterium carminicum]KAF7600585.1 FMN-dependent NADH-azoreductase [Candidatus Dactylopiibacterium carminicum]PAS95179.1 MAG: FMN-dependent NADH-azoreductase [Candidatus Dactylopiibacterium carminicum]PAS97980.1 MAG: FMN-dependent NADH-azoreductase [Candidatus Dactylopiibacterium carminicum]PAT00590.1 MAG: FMN-dependent NADH-azoreductase [Candidatus Dactylopiibacterium carminicum]